MKVLVAGAGAVGCILGGALLRNGHEAVFLARGSNLDRLLLKGLRVEFPDATWEFPSVRAISSGSPAENFDAILFCVKGYDREQAAREVLRFPSPWILTFQNGVVTHKELAQLAPWSVAPSVIYVAADRIEPGVIGAKGAARVVLDGSKKSAAITAPLDRALAIPQVRVQMSDNIELDLWRKYLFLCSFSAVNTLTEKPAAAIVENLRVRNVWTQMMREIAAVARASGIDVTEADVENALANAAKLPLGTNSSLLADTRRKHRTEVELLQGHLVQLAEALGVEATFSRVLYALLQLKTQH